MRPANAIVLLFSLGIPGWQPVAAQVVDLGAHWPGQAVTDQRFLYRATEPAVFWFMHRGQGRFRAFNWWPHTSCHHDEFTWSGDNLLRYEQTADACGTAVEATVLEPPMVFFPRQWNPASGPWIYGGESAHLFLVDEVLVAEGRNRYVNEILGWEEVEAGMLGVRWRTRQEITWTSGPDAGSTTRWEENWWLGSVPGYAGARPGLQRTLGGNIDMDWPQWDIAFDRWRPLPARIDVRGWPTVHGTKPPEGTGHTSTGGEDAMAGEPSRRAARVRTSSPAHRLVPRPSGY